MSDLWAVPGGVLGRATERAQLHEALMGGHAILLAGAPGYGKSLLLDVAAQDLRATPRAPAVTCVRLGDAISWTHAAERIVAGAAQALWPAEAAGAEETVRRSCLAWPRVGVYRDPTTWAWSIARDAARLAPSMPRAEEAVVLLEALAVVARLARLQKTLCAVLLDDAGPWCALLPSLEVRGRLPTGVGLALAVTTTAPVRPPGGRPVETLWVRALDYAALTEGLAARWIARGLAEELAPLEVAIAVVESLDEHPEAVMRATVALEWRLGAPGGWQGTPEALVDAAIADAVAREGRQFAALWRQFAPGQRATLAAIVQTGGQHLFGNAGRQVANLGLSTLQRAVEQLEADHVVVAQTSSSPRRVTWRFTDPLFAKWVRRLLT